MKCSAPSKFKQFKHILVAYSIYSFLLCFFVCGRALELPHVFSTFQWLSLLICYDHYFRFIFPAEWLNEWKEIQAQRDMPDIWLFALCISLNCLLLIHCSVASSYFPIFFHQRLFNLLSFSNFLEYGLLVLLFKKNFTVYIYMYIVECCWCADGWTFFFFRSLLCFKNVFGSLDFHWKYLVVHNFQSFFSLDQPCGKTNTNPAQHTITLSFSKGNK